MEDELRGTWWRDAEGGALVRVEGVGQHRGEPAVLVAAPEGLGGWCEVLPLRMSVFEARFVRDEDARG